MSKQKTLVAVRSIDVANRGVFVKGQPWPDLDAKRADTMVKSGRWKVATEEDLEAWKDRQARILAATKPKAKVEADSAPAFVGFSSPAAESKLEILGELHPKVLAKVEKTFEDRGGVQDPPKPEGEGAGSGEGAGTGEGEGAGSGEGAGQPSLIG